MKDQVSRREFLERALALGAAATFGLQRFGHAAPPQGKAQVFFTRDISVKGLLQVYSRVNRGITGKVGIKLHTGEPHGPNVLPIGLIKGLQARIPNSTIVECNVLYSSPRHTTAGHLTTLATNGFNFCPVDIMDAGGSATLPIPGMRELLAQWPDPMAPGCPFAPGTHLLEVAVGRNLLNYDSLLVYTHFKGHLMGGYGGSLKNIGIGCASASIGKALVHGSGFPTGPIFLERMAESGKGIASHFGQHITYINVLKNISVDCDCAANGVPPTCPDIGIVASTDILAVEQASIDLLYAMPAEQRRDVVARIESRSGLHQLTYMKTLEMGNAQYELVDVGGYTTADTVVALHSASGLGAISPNDASRLDLANTGDSAGIVDMADAVALARNVAGLDP